MNTTIKQTFATFALSTVFIFGGITTVNAQYKQEEKVKHPVQDLMPSQPFDATVAKDALAEGSTTLTGRVHLSFGKALSTGAQTVSTSNIIVTLYPLTPYFEEWYNMKTTQEKIKKNIYVFMGKDAAKYVLTCETDSKGKFTFPKMKPGKYILQTFVHWEKSWKTQNYQGTAYGSDGYSANYYTPGVAGRGDIVLVMEIVDIKPGEKEVHHNLSKTWNNANRILY